MPMAATSANDAVGIRLPPSITSVETTRTTVNAAGGTRRLGETRPSTARAATTTVTATSKVSGWGGLKCGKDASAESSGGAVAAAFATVRGRFHTPSTIRKIAALL